MGRGEMGGLKVSRRKNFPAVRCAAIAAMWLAGAPAARAMDAAPPPLLVAIVGDSTVATYDAASPVHGWGEFIQRRMRPRVLVHNFAAGGASTSSFLAEGRWDAALADKPSVVLIQFGHNDSAQAASLGRFEANLERFVESARACGATPILVTPVQLRVFRDGKFVPSLQA